jgi:hypothetical protein
MIPMKGQPRMLTARQFAAAREVAYTTVINWLNYGDTPTVAVEESDEDWNDAEAYIEEGFGDTSERHLDHVVMHTFSR